MKITRKQLRNLINETLNESNASGRVEYQKSVAEEVRNPDQQKAVQAAEEIQDAEWNAGYSAQTIQQQHRVGGVGHGVEVRGLGNEADARHFANLVHNKLGYYAIASKSAAGNIVTVDPVDGKKAKRKMNQIHAKRMTPEF